VLSFLKHERQLVPRYVVARLLCLYVQDCRSLQSLNQARLASFRKAEHHNLDVTVLDEAIRLAIPKELLNSLEALIKDELRRCYERVVLERERCKCG
jgi:hypothetical protein